MKLVSIILALALTACTTDITGKLQWDKAKAGRIAAAVGNVALNDAGKIAIGALAGVTASVVNGNTGASNIEQGAADYAWRSIGSIDVAGDLAAILAAAGPHGYFGWVKTSAFATIAPQVGSAQAVNLIAGTISTSAQ